MAVAVDVVEECPATTTTTTTTVVSLSCGPLAGYVPGQMSVNMQAKGFATSAIFAPTTLICEMSVVPSPSDWQE